MSLYMRIFIIFYPKVKILLHVYSLQITVHFVRHTRKPWQPPIPLSHAHINTCPSTFVELINIFKCPFTTQGWLLMVIDGDAIAAVVRRFVDLLDVSSFFPYFLEAIAVFVHYAHAYVHMYADYGYGAS